MANSLNKINSGGIKDDSIVNADIKSDAAIALSKLASTPAVLTGSTNNTITTVTGANAIQGEANLTYDGTDLKVTTDANGEGIVMYSSGSTFSKLSGDANRASENQSCLYIEGNWNGTAIGAIDFVAGPDTTNKDDGHIKFQTTTSGSSIAERMRIDSSGRIFAGASTQPSGDNRTLNLCSTSTTEAGLSFSRSSTTMGSGSTTGQSIRLMTDGSLTFNEHNVGEKFRLRYGGGLTFNGDTAAANALDDYEEGTWNAAIQGAEGGGPTSYSGSGSYIKIGRLVTATVSWSNVTFPGLGGELEITAPFAAGSDAKNPRGGWCYFHPNSAWDDYTDMVGMGARISAGSSTFKLDVFLKDDVPTSQSAGSGARNGNISEASAIYLDFSITYITA